MTISPLAPPSASIGAAVVSRPSPAAVQTEIALSQDRARALIALRPQGTRCNYKDSLNDRHSSSELFGVPDFAKLALIGDDSSKRESDPSDTMTVSAARVFRQYVRTEDEWNTIRSTGMLIPGMLCFYENGGPHGVPYRDLVGVFLTTPEFKPDDVGVPDSKRYVDFQLPSGIGMLHLSHRDDRYWMIPGIPQRARWYREYYSKWIEKGAPDAATSMDNLRKSGYDRKEWGFADSVSEFEEIRASGGFPEPTHISIHIVGSGIYVRP